MEKVRKKIGCFSLACFLIISNFMIAKAEALPDVISGSTTLADNIMSYYALSGAAVGNTDWINTLYNSFGSSFGTIEELAQQGYLVLNDAGMWEPVEQLGQMIEQVPAYSSLGLNEMFSVSSAEVAAGGGLAVASGGSILAGSLGGVASTGVIPLFGGVTAAYWGGIAIGTIAAHALGLYGKNISNGIDINTVLSNIPNGASCCILIGLHTSSRYYYVSNATIAACTSNGTSCKLYIMGSPNQSYTIMNAVNNSSVYSGTFNNKGRAVYNNISIGNFKSINPLYVVDDQYQSNFLDGTSLPSRKSPDVIGPNGNQTGSYDSETKKYDVPDVKPMIDPQTQAGKPLTLQDWLNFANSVKNNNSSADPFGNNADLFNNIMDLIVTRNPGSPDSDPDPDPWSPPVVTPVPDPSYPDPVPDQPTSENPDESETSQETEPLSPVDTGKPWMLPDLTKKFPFCIPWDIKDCFTLLKSNIRQAPHITWRFNPPNTPIDYTFNLDLSDFEAVAILLRTLELIAFIAGLAFATRYLIGAS